MRMALQRLSNLLLSPTQLPRDVRAAATEAGAVSGGAKCASRDSCDTVDIGDSFTALGDQVTEALRERPRPRTARLRAMVSDDASRAAFGLGFQQLVDKAPQLRHLAVNACGWLKVPSYRTADNRLQALPHAPRWQWPHAYPLAPEVPHALRGLQQLRSVQLSEKLAAAVSYLPPSVLRLQVELGSASELMPRQPVRLPSVRTLELTTLCERLPEAARIIEGAPRLERLDLRLNNARVGDDPARFDILWPATLQSLRIELRELPPARWHGPTGELSHGFLGGLWRSLPPVKGLVLDVADTRAPLSALVLEMAGWRGRGTVERVVIRGVTATPRDRQALCNLLPREASVSIQPAQ